MLTETILGIALAAAVIGVILLVRSTLPKKFATPGVQPVTVFRCTGDAAGLEAAMREPWGARTDLYILDEGMSGDALRRAQLLAARYGAEITKELKFTEDTGSTDGRD